MNLINIILQFARTFTIISFILVFYSVISYNEDYIYFLFALYLLALSIGLYSLHHTCYVLCKLLDIDAQININNVFCDFIKKNMIGLVPSFCFLILGAFSVSSPLNFRLGMISVSFLFLIYYFSGIMSNLSEYLIVAIIQNPCVKTKIAVQKQNSK
jgi:hypothetical protein